MFVKKDMMKALYKMVQNGHKRLKANVNIVDIILV